jgi:hypothetical protein
MARDFAKGKQANGRKKTPARKKPARGKSARKQPAAAIGGGWRWFGAGVLTGVFLSFLLYLGALPSPGDPASEATGNPQAAAAPPKPRFDFYNLLPGQTMDVDIDVEPAPEVLKPAPNTSANEYYLLQAGSFRQAEEADRRRAQLVMLNLEPTVEESTGDNGRLYRVYVGPFESRSRMNKARSLTAGDNIETMVVKRTRP